MKPCVRGRIAGGFRRHCGAEHQMKTASIRWALALCYATFLLQAEAGSDWMNHKDWYWTKNPVNGQAEAYTPANNVDGIYATVIFPPDDACHRADLFLETGDGVALSQRELRLDLGGATYTYTPTAGAVKFELADITGDPLKRLQQGSVLWVHRDGATYRFSLAGSAAATTAAWRACDQWVKRQAQSGAERWTWDRSSETGGAASWGISGAVIGAGLVALVAAVLIAIRLVDALSRKHAEREDHRQHEEHDDREQDGRKRERAENHKPREQERLETERRERQNQAEFFRQQQERRRAEEERAERERRERQKQAEFFRQQQERARREQVREERERRERQKQAEFSRQQQERARREQVRKEREREEHERREREQQAEFFRQQQERERQERDRREQERQQQEQAEQEKQAEFFRQQQERERRKQEEQRQVAERQAREATLLALRDAARGAEQDAMEPDRAASAPDRDLTIAACLQLLGLDEDASAETIADAYERRRHTYDPDRVSRLGDQFLLTAEALTRKLEQAMQMLRDQGRA